MKHFGKAIRASIPLQLVHPDIFDPMNIRTRHGTFYFISFIDDLRATVKYILFPISRKHWITLDIT